jgi:hypothetical protein
MLPSPLLYTISGEMLQYHSTYSIEHFFYPKRQSRLLGRLCQEGGKTCLSNWPAVIGEMARCPAYRVKSIIARMFQRAQCISVETCVKL